MLQRIVCLGTNTKASLDQYLDIFALLSVNRGPLDFYLMPSLNLWIVSADSFVPQEGSRLGVFLGRFDRRCTLSELREQLDFAIIDACHFPHVEDEPEEDVIPTPPTPALSYSKYSGQLRLGWLEKPFSINGKEGKISGGIVPQIVV